jgi:hypothetical protein
MGILGKHDVETWMFGIEVKDRKKCVINSWMEQAVRNCPKGKTPMLVIHITNKGHEEDLVCLRMPDWKEVMPKDGSE